MRTVDAARRSDIGIGPQPTVHDAAVPATESGGRAWSTGRSETALMGPTGTSDGIEEHTHVITGEPGDYEALLHLIGDRRFVLIGEASHGTHDFYTERARITRRLIDECGFTAVAVEADWPDAYRVNRYVMGLSDDADADTALSDFRRFPAWMRLALGRGRATRDLPKRHLRNTPG